MPRSLLRNLGETGSIWKDDVEPIEALAVDPPDEDELRAVARPDWVDVIVEPGHDRLRLASHGIGRMDVTVGAEYEEAIRGCRWCR